MAETFSAILAIVFAVFCFIAYHSIFDVMYFDLGKGLFKEIIGCLIGGVILASIAVDLWWAVDIMLVLVALSQWKKGKIGIALFSIVMITLVAIVGIGLL